MLTYGSNHLQANASAGFWEGYWSVMDPWVGLVYEKDSTQETETETWLGAPALPQEWVGDLEGESVPEQSQTITNKHWGSRVNVHKKFEKFQQWDAVSSLTRRLGEKAGEHIASRLTTLLAAGTSSTCYDGQYFIDTDHKDPGAVYTSDQDNDLTTDITDKDAPTAANIATGIRSCISAFYGFKDDQGDPMCPNALVGNPGDFVVMVPPSMLTLTRQVLVADTLSAAGDNDLKGTFTLRCNPRLTATDTFYVFYATSNHKPFISQTAGGVMFEDDKDMDSGHYIYTASYWGETQYGQWRTCIGYHWTNS